MTNVANEKRDISAIKRREKINLMYLISRKISKIIFSKSDKPVETILMYPAITKKEKLADLLNRFSWGFPEKENLKLYIAAEDNLKNINLNSLNLPQVQRKYLNNVNQMNLVSKDEAKRLDIDLILITEASSLLESFIIKNIGKTLIIDKEFFSTEESDVWKQGYYKTLDKHQLQYYRTLSKNNYRRLMEENKNKSKAYCFVTGPSFDRYKEFNFENESFKIICNSIVKNNEFLEYIKKPDLLVFADPVFHFSPCEYSAIFRDHVLEVFKKYKCFVMIPEETVPLMLAHYPELTNYLIGMPVGKNLNLPSLDYFFIKGSSNILTLFMLPVASAISGEIFVIGADGRNPDEKYFWQHSSSVQYHDLMQTVFETHPSFFRDRDYKDYYEQHCSFLENLITYGESLGKQYFSLTPSYIPALQKRQMENISKELQ